MDQETLNRLADELLQDGDNDEFREAHEAIAAALRDGDHDAALDLCEGVPDTYAWLRGEGVRYRHEADADA